MTQFGLGIGVMSVGLFVLGSLPPPRFVLWFPLRVLIISFVTVWYTVKVFLLLPPHLFDLFLYLRFG